MSLRHCSVRAAAKINLYLEVLGQRADGFHELETVFQLINLYDDIEISESLQAGTRVVYENADYDFGTDDICYRAVEALRSQHADMTGVDVRIKKQIPVGAGLGGASSDAAAILRALSAWYPLEQQVLHDIALELGSDVPFFLIGGTAYARGRGEILTPIDQPKQNACYLLLPAMPQETAAVFKSLTDEERGPREARGAEVLLGSGAFINRLSAAACRLNSTLAQLFADAKALDINIYMSGSGSACFSFDQAACDLPGISAMPISFINDAGAEIV